MTPPRMRLYTKPGCKLCLEGKALIGRLRKEIEFDLEEVDISRDPQLMERYQHRIPVVEVNGVEVDELLLTERCLRRALMPDWE